jgi:hypothetical protein
VAEPVQYRVNPIRPHEHLYAVEVRFPAADARQSRQTGLGIWASEFTPPWDWREGQRIAREVGQLGEDCNVKGVIDDDGARIYLVPTDRAFAKTTVDQGKGEQLFCSDEEARLAGWRRPGEAHRPAAQ